MRAGYCALPPNDYMLDYLPLASEWLLFDMIEMATITLSTRLSGYQPQYFPRLHYFARMFNSDVFTISDYLQYVRKHVFTHKDGTECNGVSYQAHTPVKTHQSVGLLGIPIVRDRHPLIRDAKIDYSSPWYEKHLHIVRDSYRKAPYFSIRFPELEKMLMERQATLSDLSVSTIAWALCVLFELPVGSRQQNIDAVARILPHADFRLKKLVLLHEQLIPPPNKRLGRDANTWLIDQCKTFGASEYYFGGTSAAAYMDFSRFSEAGIALVEQDWHCKAYAQLYGDFVPNLSIIDLVMNVSPNEARSILQTAHTRAV